MRNWPTGRGGRMEARGERLAIRPKVRDGHYGIFFGSRQVATIDLTAGKSVSDVSEQVSAMSPD
jgi:putative transposase